MKLRELIPNIIGGFENIQLFDAKSAKTLSSIVDLALSNPNEVEEVLGHLDDEVFGISSAVIKGTTDSYIRITLITEIDIQMIELRTICRFKIDIT